MFGLRVRQSIPKAQACKSAYCSCPLPEGVVYRNIPANGVFFKDYAFKRNLNTEVMCMEGIS